MGHGVLYYLKGLRGLTVGANRSPSALLQLAITMSPGNRNANAFNALPDVQDACFLPLASC
jgi:hypothetical protein